MLAVTTSLSGGALSVIVDAADAVSISTVAGNVKVNGVDPTGGPIARAALTGLNVQATGNFDNTVDLTGLGTSAVSLLSNVSISTGNGDDTITLGALSAGSLSLIPGSSSGDHVSLNGPLVLGSLQVVSHTISLGASSIRTSGSQVYTGATLLTSDVTLDTGLSSNAGVLFSGTVDSSGASRSLAIYSAGLTRFDANIGAVTPLANLTTAAGGQTSFFGTSIRTTGAARFGDPVVFNANTAIDAGGQIAFGQTLASSPAGVNSLVLNSSTGLAFESHPTSGNLLTSFSGVTLAGPITFPANLPPVAAAPVTLNANEDAGTVAINFQTLFTDDFESSEHLTYLILNQNTGLLVSSTNVDHAGNLTLSLAPNQSGSGSLTIRAIDAGDKFADAQINLNVTAVNDAPVNQLPAPQHVESGRTVPLAGISVNDVDAGNTPIKVTLSVSSGFLTINPTIVGGVTQGQIFAPFGSLVSIIAPLSAINTTFAAPDGVSYLSQLGVFGTAVLTMTTNDLGNTGGGALVDTDTTSITVGLREVEVAPGRWQVFGSSFNDDVVINYFPGGVVSYSAFNLTRTFVGVTQFEFGGDRIDRVEFHDHSGAADTYYIRPQRFDVFNGSTQFRIANPSFEVYGESADTALIEVDFGRTTISDQVVNIGTFHSTTVKDFDRVWVFGTPVSEIVINDRPGRDVVYLGPGNSSVVRSSGAFAVVVGGGQFIANGNPNEDDIAVFYDTPGNDSFTSAPSFAQLLGPDFNATANSYRYVFAFANPGRDIATMYDSPGNDVFFGYPTNSVLVGPGYFVQTIGYDAAVVVAGGGVDLAYLYDSPETDYFYGSPEISILSNPSYYNQVFRFEYVWAYAIAGGQDFAYLAGSPDSNTLTGSGSRFTLQLPNSLLDLTGFDEVNLTTPQGSVVRRNTIALNYVLRTTVQTV